MKYAFCVLFALFLINTNSYAQTIKSFSDSPALISIAEFMEDSASDMKTSYRISDKKLKFKDTSTCQIVPKSAVLKEVESAVKKVLRLYPDEELPFEDALNDLADYLVDSSYKKCVIAGSNLVKEVSSVYFFNGSDNIHVKVDTITLVAE